jgi:hypothetical protein
MDINQWVAKSDFILLPTHSSVIAPIVLSMKPENLLNFSIATAANLTKTLKFFGL